MNVLQIVPELNAGGVERTVLEVSRALVAAGHGSHVASQGGRMVDQLISEGGQFHDMPLASKNPFSIGGNAMRIMQCIDLYDIDIVHARSRAPAFAACKAAEGKGIPFVTTYHGIYNSGNPLKRYYNSIMTKGEAVIANSQFTADHIIKEHKTDPAKITVIHRGVDMREFSGTVSDTQRTAVRNRWGVSGDDYVVLLPGRLTRWKGQLVAIRAMQNIGNAVLVLQGDAQGRDEYVAELRAAIGGARLIIADHDSDMAAAYAASNLVLSCSTDPEAFGRVAAEAGAMGRIVIASAHGGSLETILDGQTGFHVPVGNPEALTERIHAVMALSPETRQAIKQSAQARIRKHFTTQAMCNAVLAVYAQLVSPNAQIPLAKPA